MNPSEGVRPGCGDSVEYVPTVFSAYRRAEDWRVGEEIGACGRVLLALWAAVPRAAVVAGVLVLGEGECIR